MQSTTLLPAQSTMRMQSAYMPSTQSTTVTSLDGFIMMDSVSTRLQHINMDNYVGTLVNNESSSHRN